MPDARLRDLERSLRPSPPDVQDLVARVQARRQAPRRAPLATLAPTLTLAVSCLLLALHPPPRPPAATPALAQADPWELPSSPVDPGDPWPPTCEPGEAPPEECPAA